MSKEKHSKNQPIHPKKSELDHTINRLIPNTINECIILADANYKIIDINEAVLTLTGYDIHEFKDQNLDTIFNNTSFDAINSQVKKGREGLISSHKSQLYLLNKTGGTIILDSRISIINHETNNYSILITALPQTNYLFESLFNNLLNGIILLNAGYDENGRFSGLTFIDVNSSFEKLSGLKKESIINKKVSELLPDSSEQWEQIYHKCKGKNDVLILDKYPMLFNKYFSISGFCHDDNIFLMVFEDLTDKKNIDNELLVEKYLLQNLLDQIPDTIYYKDINGQFTRINKAQATVLGLQDPEDAIGKSDFDFFEFDHAKVAYEDEQMIIRTGYPLIDKMEVIRRADGCVRYVSATKVPIYNWNKDITGIVGISRDITERIKYQEALAQSEKRFRALWENIDNGMRLTNSNGIVIEVNDAYCKMVNYSKDELIGRNFNIVYGSSEDEDKFAANKYITQFTTKSVLPTLETILNLRRAPKIIVEVSNIFFEYEHGENYLLSIFKNITQRKEAETAMFENELRYRTLFENSSDGIVVFGQKFEDCNPTLCSIYNCKKEDIIGHSFENFAPEYQPNGKKSSELIEQYLKTAFMGNPMFFYFQQRTNDNRVIDTEINLSSINIGGRTLVQATIRDITERLQNEKTRNALYKISEAVNTSQDIQNLYNEIHFIIKSLMNAENFYIALYDEKTEMVSFDYYVDLVDDAPPSHKLRRGLTEYVLRTESSHLISTEGDEKLRLSGEVELIGKPAAIWLGVPLQIENKTIGVIVVQDYENENAFSEKEKQILEFVSKQIAQAIQRKKGQEELIRIANELKILNANKDKLFSIIAHDLRSPFHGLFGFTEILANDFDSLSKSEVKNINQELYKTVRQQFKLLENLLDWSRLQIGRMEFQPIKINILEKAALIIDLLIGNAIRKNISIVNEIKDNFTVWADEKMLNSIMQNLISNAIKFTPNGGSILLSSRVVDDEVEISVKDSGIGIKESELKLLFRIDVQHSTKGTANEKGTGLGLLLCKELVEKQNGRIKVESKAGKGSVFTFYLPHYTENVEIFSNDFPVK